MKNLFLIILMLIIGAIGFNCSKNGSINESTQEKQSRQGKVLLKIDKDNIPTEVAEIKASLSRNGYETLQSSMNLLSDSTADLTLDDITPGTWHLKVDAENSEDVIIYTGESEVEVVEGTTVQVNLTLLPTGAGTGNIYVVVGWGRTKTLTLQPDGETGKDAVLSDYTPNGNFGAPYTDFLITSWTWNGLSNQHRSLLEFNLTSIPENSKIQKAQLSLYYNSTTNYGYGEGHAGENAFYIERVTTPWQENTVTWNNQPGSTSLNAVTVAASTSPTQNYLNMDVTKLVQDMINNPDESFGFKCRLVNEIPYARVILYSSDCDFPAKRPKLVVSYY